MIIVSFKDIAGPHTRVWIVGSSIVKHAFARARSSFEGPQRNRQAASLWWQGRKSLRWCHVSGLIRTLLSYKEEPDDIRLDIVTILDTVHSLLPHTKFVYSQILPRLHEVKHYAIEKARKRLNAFVASIIISAGGCYIKYPDICEEFQLN